MRLLLLVIPVFFTVCCFITPINASAEKAPLFVLQGDNKKIKLSSLKGRVVYVDFWASWCEPCRHSFSWMNKLQSQYGEEKFSIVAINLDESHEAAKEFLQKIPATFDVAYDPLGKVAEAYRLKAMPSSFLINKKGEVVYSNVGFHGKDKAKLEKHIDALLGKGMLASQ